MYMQGLIVSIDQVEMASRRRWISLFPRAFGQVLLSSPYT